MHPSRRHAIGILMIAGLNIMGNRLPAAEHTKDSLKTVKKNVDEEKAVLLDVREKSEWDDGHVAGAVLLPLSDLKKGMTPESLQKKLPKDRIVYTHCAVGKRSLTAADLLSKQGYDVRPLKAGYRELLEAGFKKAAE
jgi:phage shock protein E